MKRRHATGMTLVELMLALTIFSIISLAVASLVFAAFNVNRYAGNEGTALWDADFAWHRMSANAMAAVPAASSGMTPTVTTDSNGQSRLTFIVPDVANNTTRTIKYYCTGTTAPFTLVEDDNRYNTGNAANVPNPIAANVQSFSVTLDASTTMKIWVDLQVRPSAGWTVRRNFCVNARNF
jgi:prepilin-type N-terminal cleavage/methylation domain-containing protein